MPDEWSDGSGYESYVGRWSRNVAREFLRWLAVRPGSAWLDFGCGTGALSQTILADVAPRIVVGCDRSPGYVAFARQRTADRRASFVVVEVVGLPQIPGGFDAVVAGLVLNFLPVPGEGVAAMTARARKGGTVGAYVWDYAEGMQLMRTFWDAAVALDPGSRELDEGVRFPLCREEPLRALFQGVGVRDVRVHPIVVPTVLRDFDDYWTPFLGGQGPAPAYAMSLSPERRMELRDMIRRHLPASLDGTISLSARAWAEGDRHLSLRWGCRALAGRCQSAVGWPRRRRGMTRIVAVLGLAFGGLQAIPEDLARTPVFFALSVPDLDASVKWYVQNLGLKPTRLPGSPEAKVALLAGQGLLLELVEHSRAFDVEARLPGLQGRYLLHGIFKVGFFVRDLDSTVDGLKKRGVRFKGSVFADDVAGARSILVLDNNGNIIQLFEAIRAERR